MVQIAAVDGVDLVDSVDGVDSLQSLIRVNLQLARHSPAAAGRRLVHRRLFLLTFAFVIRVHLRLVFAAGFTEFLDRVRDLEIGARADLFSSEK